MYYLKFQETPSNFTPITNKRRTEIKDFKPTIGELNKNKINMTIKTQASKEQKWIFLLNQAGPLIKAYTSLILLLPNFGIGSRKK